MMEEIQKRFENPWRICMQFFHTLWLKKGILVFYLFDSWISQSIQPLAPLLEQEGNSKHGAWVGGGNHMAGKEQVIKRLILQTKSGSQLHGKNSKDIRLPLEGPYHVLLGVRGFGFFHFIVLNSLFLVSHLKKTPKILKKNKKKNC